MHSVYFDARIDDETRRAQLYDGQLHVLSPGPGARGLCQLAQDLSAEAFAPHAPPEAQYDLAVERYVAILADLKPRFIHHSRAKELIRDLLAEWGCDLDATYFDVPRLRTMTSGDYLRAGLALQFHPHRDTWFSAPFAQINWWLPVYPITSENCMAFHPRYWADSVRNSFNEYDYERWSREGRQQAATQVKADTRKQPKALDALESDPQVRLVPDVAGTILFSAAQMHSTVANTSGRTRFSIDFRTVNLEDLRAGRGAPNLDSACTGTTLGDYMRASDLTPLPADVVARYNVPAAA